MMAESKQRNFRFISTLGFAATLMCTWEATLLYVAVKMGLLLARS